MLATFSWKKNLADFFHVVEWLKTCFLGVIFRKCSVNSALRGGFYISGDGYWTAGLFFFWDGLLGIWRIDLVVKGDSKFL